MNGFTSWLARLIAAGTLGSVLIGLVAAFAAAPEPDDLAEQATRAFDIQSYREAIAKADAYLKTLPAGPKANAMRRVRGISLIRLNDFPKGLAALKELVSQDPNAAKDPLIAVAIAEAHLKAGNQTFATTREAVDSAISLFKGEKNAADRINLLFRLAEYYQQRVHLFQDFTPGRQRDFRAAQIRALAAALECFERILADTPNDEQQVAALSQSSTAVLNASHALTSLPRDQWPDVRFKKDMTKPFDVAIGYLRDIIQRLPRSPSAAVALRGIGGIQESQLQDLLAAKATYQDVIKQYPNTQPAREAAERIASITAPEIRLQLAGVATPGTKPSYTWHARNVKVISFAAYPVELFDLLRKVEDLNQLDRYPLAGREPAFRWTLQTGDKGDHKPVGGHQIKSEMPFSESGAYLVVAKGFNVQEKETVVRGVALVSRLAMLTKDGLTRSAILVADSESGKPVAGASILSQRFVRAEQVPVLNIQRRIFEYSQINVPDGGVAEIERPANRQDPNRQLVLIARAGKDYAVCDSHFWWGWWGRPDGTFAYAYTDRPVYRPSQTVNFKLILREAQQGSYANLPGAKTKIRLHDARGETAYERDLTASENGTVAGSFTLGEEPPLGMWRFSLEVNGSGVGDLGPGASFRVEEYKKPEFLVTTTTEKPTYKIGETMNVRVHGEYYFGGAVANAQVTYEVKRQGHSWFFPWRGPYDDLYDDSDGGGAPFGRSFPGRGMPWNRRQDVVKRGILTTDAKGDAVIDVPTAAMPGTPNEDVEYIIAVDMVDQSRRSIKASQVIKVTHKAFSIFPRARASLYQPGDTVRIEVSARNPNGGEVPFSGKVEIARVTQREEFDESGKIKTPEKLHVFDRRDFAAKVGSSNELSFNVDEAGYFKVTFAAPDPYGGTIDGSVYVWVAKGSGELGHLARRDLEIVLDKEAYAAGETMKILVTTRHKDAHALLTIEGEDLYLTKTLAVPAGSLAIETPVTTSLRPNAVVSVSLLRDQKAFLESKPIRVPPVESFLKVTLTAPKKEFRPRETAKIDVLVTDHRGQPVKTDLSLGVVDASVFYIQSETRGDIRKFFYGRTRPHTVQTRTSFASYFGSFSMQLGRDYVREMTFGLRPSPAAGVAQSDAVAGAMLKSEAMPMRRQKMAGERGAGAKDEFAETEVRSEFPDTVFWAADLSTGSDGKGAATVRFPDSLTTWKLTAIAADPKTAVGETAIEVTTKKNVIVRLESPRFFVERDEVVLTAIAHNYLGEPKKTRVRMAASPELALLGVSTGLPEAKSTSETLEIDVDVPPGGEKAVHFLARVARSGVAKIQAQALTNEESDAVEQTFPVIEYGAEKLLVKSGILFSTSEAESEASATLTIPAEIRPGSQRLTVRATPTIAGVMLESLPYLLEYPYGCTEQTMSRFLPAVLTANTLKELGLDLAAIKEIAVDDPVIRKRLERLRKSPVFDEAEMKKMIAAGVNRLASFQQPDGGWGWWKNDSSDPYMTAYVVSGLALARDAKVALPANMLPRGVAFLSQQVMRPEPLRRYPWQRAEDAPLRAYLLYAIGQADPNRLKQGDLIARLNKSFATRDELGDYARALLALAAHRAGLREQAEILVANIKDRARVDAETGSASWGVAENYAYWYQGGNEATSYSLRALIAIEPSSPMIPQAVNWLLRHRQGTQWFNTKDTATACYAMADYLSMTGELNPDLEVTLTAGPATKTVRVTRANLFTADAEIALAGQALATGQQPVRITRKGRGNLYWTAFASFFSKEETITAAGNELFVERRYDRLTPREVKKTRKVFRPGQGEREETYTEVVYDREPLVDGAAVSSGDLLEVTLKITAKNNFEYLLFEDPKPAGGEPVEVRSGHTWGGSMGAHVELRDERVAFFTSFLSQGEHQLSYRLRAETPGVFHALPARAESMYAPLVRGNSASRVVRIIEK